MNFPSPASPAAAARFAALDGYRFIAALCVVVYHYDAEFGVGLAHVSPAVGRLNAFVDFFFILSGFVIAVAYAGRMASNADYLRFLEARVARLYPLHLLTLAGSLSLLAVAAITGLKPNHPEILALSALPANLTLMQAWGVVDHPSFNVASWSISAEWLCYLLTPLVFLAARRLSAAANLAAILAFVGLMILARNAMGMGRWTDAAHDYGAFRALPGFWLGATLAFNLERIAALWAPGPWIAPIAFVGALVALHVGANEAVVGAAFVLCIVGCALAERRGRAGAMASAPMQRLGDISYTLYMTHYLLATPVLFVARRYALAGTWGGVGAAIGTTLAVLALCFAIHRYFEMPAKKAILKWRAGGRRTFAARRA